MQTIHFPRYAYEALKHYDQGDKEHLLFQLMAYLFEGTKPDLQGWDASLFALMADDIKTREELIARGGEQAARLLTR